MPAFASRFPGTLSSFRNACAARKPRHPLLRLAIGLLGLGVVLTLVFFSVFVGMAMLSIGMLARSWRLHRQPRARDPRIVDGEFRKAAPGKAALPRA